MRWPGRSLLRARPANGWWVHSPARTPPKNPSRSSLPGQGPGTTATPRPPHLHEVRQPVHEQAILGKRREIRHRLPGHDPVGVPARRRRGEQFQNWSGCPRAGLVCLGRHARPNANTRARPHMRVRVSNSLPPSPPTPSTPKGQQQQAPNNAPVPPAAQRRCHERVVPKIGTHIQHQAPAPVRLVASPQDVVPA